MSREGDFGYDHAHAAASYLRSQMEVHGFDPNKVDDMTILGSGLGRFAEDHMEKPKAGDVSGPLVMPFRSIYEGILGIPYGGNAKVPGHSEELVIGPISGSGDDSRLVLAQSGRRHPYQGHTLREGSFWVRVGHVLGINRLWVSNAAGTITPETLKPGDLMAIADHMDVREVLGAVFHGQTEEPYEPRFPYMVGMYSRKLTEIVERKATELGINLKRGVYFRVPGSGYESPLAVGIMRHMLRILLAGAWDELRKTAERYAQNPSAEDHGWDLSVYEGPTVGAVGMSTTYEVEAAYAATQVGNVVFQVPSGFQGGIFGLSVPTNTSASLGEERIMGPSDHFEVGRVALEMTGECGSLIRESILEARKG